MNKNKIQLRICANILCNRIQMPASRVGRGALAHGEEAGGWSGAQVNLALLTLTLLLSCVTAPRTGGLTPKPEATLALVT